MGGSPKNLVRLTQRPPSEKEAKIQTGYNEKDTELGGLEEWSENELKGFSTEGFMMVAAVDLSLVRSPEKSSTEGESGVTGWKDLPLIEVAIWKIGNKFELSSGYSAIQNEVDRISREAAEDQFNLEDYLSVL
jgi:hypothetical protein